MRARRVGPEWMKQLQELLSDLLKYGQIQFSDSPWASPMIIVLKENKKDIRLWIDYRSINTHTFGKRSISFDIQFQTEASMRSRITCKPFKELTVLTSLRYMQSFLSCLNFFSRFIENFSIAARCLYVPKDQAS